MKDDYEVMSGQELFSSGVVQSLRGDIRIVEYKNPSMNQEADSEFPDENYAYLL